MLFLRLAVTIFFVAVALFGCIGTVLAEKTKSAEKKVNANVTVLITDGKARSAVDVNEVTVYLDPPSQYKTVALLEACCSYTRSTQETQEQIINEVKSQAAKLGANGILLTMVGERKTAITETFDKVSSDERETGRTEWRAIYVVSE